MADELKYMNDELDTRQNSPEYRQEAEKQSAEIDAEA